MSTIREKLEHFNEVILKDAAAERNRMLEQIKTNMEERIKRETKKYQKQADELIKREISAAENDKNNILSRALVESRKQLMKTREGIIESVFSDVRKHLESFVTSDEYFAYLSDQIIHSCTLGGGNELTVYLTGKDMQRFSLNLSELKAELPPSTCFEKTDDEIIGGCLVLNRAENILVNATLLEKLQTSREKFLEICELRIY